MRLQLNELERFVGQVLSFHNTSAVELKESAIISYTNHNLNQTLDMANFANTLKQSYLLGLCKYYKFWIKFFKRLPTGDALPVLRENAGVINVLINVKEFKTLADKEIVYCCGKFFV